jgi:O-antigen/teichoic acid export membrane protein
VRQQLPVFRSNRVILAPVEGAISTTGPLAPDAVGEEAIVTPPPEPADSGGASATRAIKSNVVASLLIQGLNMISGVELARGLGLIGRGELAAAMLWPMVIGGIGVLGLEESMTFHVAKAKAGSEVGRLLGSALALCAFQAVLFTVITLIAVPLALHRHDSGTITSGLIYSGFVAMNMFGLAMNGTLNGLHRYGSYNAARLSIGFAIVGAQTVLLILGTFSVRTIVVVIMGCYVACLLFDIALTWRARPGRLRADPATARQIFSYGLRSATSNTSSFLNQRLDQLVISAFLTARQLGIYVVAITFTLFTPLIGASIGVAALPNIARLDSREEQALLARRMVSASLIISIVVSVPIIVLAPLLIKLFFGSAFSIGGDITRVTAVASISFSTTRTLEGVLRGVGRPLDAGIAEVVALGGTVISLATLLPTLGLIGAAWASLLAYTVSGVWMSTRIKRVLDLPIRQLFTPDRAGIDLLLARVRTMRTQLAARRISSPT